MITSKEKNCFGLDFSETILRLVQLTKSKKEIRLKAFGEIKVPKELIVDGEIKDEPSLADLMKILIKKATGSITTKNVIASLPEKRSFIKVIELPVSDQNINDQVKKELPNHLPMSIDDIYYDFQILEKNEMQTKIVLGATPKKIIDSHTRVLEKAGLSPQVLEIESVAITRSLIDLKRKKDQANLIIDLGLDRSTFILADGDIVMFIISDSEICGNNMTKIIADKLHLNITEAEKAKILFGLDQKSGKGSVKRVLTPTINLLKEKIIQTINYYNNNFAKAKPIDLVIFCGGSAQLKGLIDSLSLKSNNRLGQIILGNPLINLKSNQIKIPQDKLLSFPTAIGLALRGIKKHD